MVLNAIYEDGVSSGSRTGSDPVVGSTMRWMPWRWDLPVGR